MTRAYSRNSNSVRAYSSRSSSPAKLTIGVACADDDDDDEDEEDDDLAPPASAADVPDDDDEFGHFS